MKKTTFNVQHLSPERKKIRFESGEEIFARHVCLLQDFVLAESDSAIHIMKRDKLYILATICFSNKYYEEEFDAYHNIFSMKYYGAGYFATFDFDAMTCDIRQSEEKKNSFVKFHKSVNNDFFYTLETATKGSRYLQFSTHGKEYRYFLRLDNFVVYGESKNFFVRSFRGSERHSLIVADKIRLSEIRAQKDNISAIVFVQENGEESVYDLVYNKVLSGPEVVKKM
ncbi:MAG: hypothetical protein ACK5N8_01850 [Alphaproteobacteria bacterium]